MSKILVTGGAGFIGSAIVRKLIQNSNQVTVFDNEFRGSFDRLKKEHVQFVRGDITRYKDWEKLPHYFDSIFHLGAINGTKYFYEIPEKVLETNVKGIINMIDFVKKNQIPDVLFSSSSEVYGIPEKFPTSEKEPLKIPDPLNSRFSYSGSKMLGELFCINFSKKYNFRYTIVRYHNIYGPDMGHEHVIPQFIHKLMKNEEFSVEGDGTETRSFCYIDDAVAGTLLVHSDQTFRDRIFNIGNPEEMSISALVNLLAEISRKKIIPKFFPKKNLGTKRRLPDISKASSIGFKPQTPLRKGLKITFDWYSKFYSQEV